MANATASIPLSKREPVGDFSVYLVRRSVVDSNLASSTMLLRQVGKPTVMHFYDGG